jgi:hypothetical protein
MEFALDENIHITHLAIINSAYWFKGTKNKLKYLFQLVAIFT